MWSWKKKRTGVMNMQHSHMSKKKYAHIINIKRALYFSDQYLTLKFDDIMFVILWSNVISFKW